MTVNELQQPVETRDVDARRRLDVAIATGRGVLFRFRHGTLLAAAAMVLLVGLTGSANTRYGLALATIYGIAILGNNALHATMHEINLGSGAFIAIGAYTAVNCVERGWSAFPAMIAAVLVASVIALVFAIPTSRLTGLATALVTFALAYSIGDLAVYLTPITGGDNGKFMAMDLGIGGLIFNGSQPGMLILATVCMVGACLVHLWLLHRTPGRVAVTVGEVGLAAAVFGTNIQAVKLGIWVWAGALGGLAGSLYAMCVGFVSATQWPILMSLLIFVGGLIGGTRSATGAWIGGIVVAALPLWLQNVVAPSSTTIFFGLIVIVALLAGGRGISQFGERLCVSVMNATRRNR